MEEVNRTRSKRVKGSGRRSGCYSGAAAPSEFQDKQEVASLETDQAGLGSAGDNALLFFFFIGGGGGAIRQGDTVPIV